MAAPSTTSPCGSFLPPIPSRYTGPAKDLANMRSLGVHATRPRRIFLFAAVVYLRVATSKMSLVSWLV